MTARNYSNTFAETTLTNSISNAATSIQIGSTTGLPASFPYTLAIDYGSSQVEMVTVTALAGSTLTVTRGQDGTAAQAHTAGARVVHPVSARDLAEPQAHMAASVDVHGLSGGASVVGTSQTQTLTNKTISGSNNTLTNIPNSALVAIDAGKVTQPFAKLTTTGADGTQQVITVTGDEVSRSTPVASWKRGGIGLLVDEDAVVDVSSDLSVASARLHGAAALTSRVYIQATAKIGAIIQRVVSQTQDLFQVLTETGTNLFKITKDGNVTAAGSITAGTSLTGATATVTGAASITGLLTASGGVSATGNVAATGTVSGATVTSSGDVTATAAVNGATAAITGTITTGNNGITVSGETWHSPSLLNGWTNGTGGYTSTKYRLLPSPAKTVEIIGVCNTGTVAGGTVVFNLPTGYRPASNHRRTVYAFGSSLNIAQETPAFDISATGDVMVTGTSLTNATVCAFHFFIPLDA